ncbi:hypothetical protein [Hydrogenophaga sp.]|uniref:lipopolysaccharide biosynthesis protein n=1 Tax=Hydrogenophaga sp. TaxID=1904254 RepID=UPI002625D933|nr:hypothetical protein [Hydrogenophaga sp.]MDM7948213.1 hypothetical protein [Hydrogenophaga sp.]
MRLRDTIKAQPGLSSLVLHGLGLVIRLGFMLAILRWSGSTLLGVFGLLVAIEMVIVYLCGLEFHTFTTRRYARRPCRTMLRLCAASHFQLLTVCAPLAVLVAVTVALVLRLHLSATELVLLGTIVATGMLSNEVGRFMVLTNRPLHSVTMTFIRTAGWQPLLLTYLGTNEELTALLALWALASLLSVSWALWIMREALGSAVRPRFRYLVRGLALSRTYYLIASASVLQSNLDRFVLQMMLGPTAVGIFTFFQTLANTLPALVQSAVLNVWLPQLLGAFGRQTPNRMELLSRVGRRSWAIGIGLSAAIGLTALPLVWLTSHPEYLGWLWILPLLLAAQILIVGSQPLHLAIYAAHKDISLMWLALGSLACGIVISVTLVSNLGLVGAAIASPCSALLLWIGRRWLFKFLSANNQI